MLSFEYFNKNSSKKQKEISVKAIAAKNSIFATESTKQNL